MPDLRGLSESEARATLVGLGLVFGSVETLPSAKKTGVILSQGLVAGRSVTQGTIVDLVVAAALPKVPSVVGASEKSAISALKKAGFAVEVVRKTVTSGSNGAVLALSPRTGTRLVPGETVRVTVAKVVRPPKPPASTPSTPVPFAGGNCTPGYDPCLPPASDYDCFGGSGNGPKYTGKVRVTGPDIYDLDRDGDGWGCDR